MPESFKEDNRPSQQWYWDDWFSAFDARLCSMAARGLWIDMLGIMFKAEIRGTLTVNGKQVDGKTLAKVIGETEQETIECLKELEGNDVFSRLKDGTIICRRMFKESKRKDEISKIRSKAGKEGAKARWQKDGKNPPRNNGKASKEKMAKMAAPSSTPSSTAIPSSKNKDLLNKKEKNPFSDEEEMQEEFNTWYKGYPIHVAEKDAQKAFNALRKKESLETIAKARDGYIGFLKHKRVKENFDQKPMYPATFLRNDKWKDFIGFRYKAPM